MERKFIVELTIDQQVDLLALLIVAQKLWDKDKYEKLYNTINNAERIKPERR